MQQILVNDKIKLFQVQFGQVTKELTQNIEREEIQFKSILNGLKEHNKTQNSNLIAMQEQLQINPKLEQEQIDETKELVQMEQQEIQSLIQVRHKEQEEVYYCKFLEQKQSQLHDQIEIMKKRNNSVSSQNQKISYKLANFQVHNNNLLSQDSCSRRKYQNYERKIEDIMFKNKHIMIDKNNECIELRKSLEDEKTQTAQNIVKIEEANILNRTLINEVYQLQGKERKILTKQLSQKQRFSEIFNNFNSTLDILSQLMSRDNQLKILQFNPILQLSKIKITELIYSNDLTQLFGYVKDVDSFITLLKIFKRGHLDQIQSHKNILDQEDILKDDHYIIEEFLKQKKLNDVLLERGQNLSDQVQYLAVELKKLNLNLSMLLNQQNLDSLFSSQQIEPQYIDSEICIIEHSLTTHQNFYLAFHQTQWSLRKHIFRIQNLSKKKIIFQLFQNISCHKQEPHLTVSDSYSHQIQYISTDGINQRQQLVIFQDYLEKQKQKAIPLEEINFKHIGQQLFPQMTKKFQQLNIQNFLKLIQNQQNHKIIQMQYKMRKQYETSLERKILSTIESLNLLMNIHHKQEFKDQLKILLSQPMIDVFLNTGDINQVISLINSDQINDPLDLIDLIHLELYDKALQVMLVTSNTFLDQYKEMIQLMQLNRIQAPISLISPLKLKQQVILKSILKINRRKKLLNPSVPQSGRKLDTTQEFKQIELSPLKRSRAISQNILSKREVSISQVEQQESIDQFLFNKQKILESFVMKNRSIKSQNIDQLNQWILYQGQAFHDSKSISLLKLRRNRMNSSDNITGKSVEKTSNVVSKIRSYSRQSKQNQSLATINISSTYNNTENQSQSQQTTKLSKQYGKKRDDISMSTKKYLVS